MNILYNILAVLFCFILGYLFGSFPTAIVVGKVFYHQDPRDYGSKNAGGTNAGRLWGKKVGLSIILFDMVKTIAPMWICWALFTFIKFDGKALCPSVDLVNNFGLNSAYIIPWPVYWMSLLGCMIGHCYPIYAKFKGGKGVSCFMGCTVTTTWMLGLIPGLLYFAILKWKKYVSLASILTSIIITVLTWIWVILVMCKVVPASLYSLPTYGINLNINWVFASIETIMCIILVVRHRGNIERLKAGTERTISWMK